MAYDKMKWHYGGSYPEGMPTENAGTHIGMYMAWCINNNLLSDELCDDAQEGIDDVLNRKMTGRDFLIEYCDESFVTDDLCEFGNLFSEYFYDAQSGGYMNEYSHVFHQYDNNYQVEDTWDNYDRLRPIIDKRFADWRSTVFNQAFIKRNY